MRGAKGALLLCPLIIACAPRATLPEQALRHFLEQVEAGRLGEAWRLTSPAYRAQCDLSCFQRVVERNRDDLRRALGQLRQGGARSELRTTVVLPEGRLLLVQRPGERWQLAGDPLDFYPQGSPEEALRSFVRALEGRRYAVALRFVPQRLRQQVTEARLRERWEGAQRQELQAQLDAVRRHLHEPFIVEGAEARLPVGDRREARLVLEDGRWYVLQLQ